MFSSGCFRIAAAIPNHDNYPFFSSLLQLDFCPAMGLIPGRAHSQSFLVFPSFFPSFTFLFSPPFLCFSKNFLPFSPDLPLFFIPLFFSIPFLPPHCFSSSLFLFSYSSPIPFLPPHSFSSSLFYSPILLPFLSSSSFFFFLPFFFLLFFSHSSFFFFLPFLFSYSSPIAFLLLILLLPPFFILLFFSHSLFFPFILFLPPFFLSPILLPFFFFLDILFPLLFFLLFPFFFTFLLLLFSLFPPFILFSWFLPPLPHLSLSCCFHLFIPFHPSVNIFSFYFTSLLNVLNALIKYFI